MSYQGRLLCLIVIFFECQLAYTGTAHPGKAMQMLQLLAFGNVAELKYKMGG